MKAADTIQLVKLLQEQPSRENAEKIVQIISEDTDQVESLKKRFPTREDILSLELRISNNLDKKFWQLVGILFVMLSFATGIILKAIH